MNLKEVAEKMKSELAEVIGRKPESVTRLYKDEKGWHARLDVLEVAKIPSATDLSEITRSCWITRAAW